MKKMLMLSTIFIFATSLIVISFSEISNSDDRHAAFASTNDNKYKMTKHYKLVPMNPNGTRKVVLLTIDDGPKSMRMNKQMLAILNKHQVKAIFFVNGYMVEKNPSVLKMIANQGHEIANHSWDHIDLSKQSRLRISKQIYDVQKIVKKITGKEPRFFRPPYGAYNNDVKSLMAPNRLTFMNWSNGSDDWMKINRSPKRVVENVMKNLEPGSIILIHELQWTILSLTEMIQNIRAKGYTFLDPQQIMTSH